MEVKHLDIVLCKFYFTDLKKSKKRPVLIFKDNLPHSDFIAIPISSKIVKMHEDELLLNHTDFAEGSVPQISKLMIRKTFVVSKEAVLKKYGTLSQEAYQNCHQSFCQHFGCSN